jgi:CheY-like chemotaxis protein
MGERYYHKIPGLLVPKTIDGDDIHHEINKFIDIVPELTNKIEDDLLNMTLKAANRSEFFGINMNLLITMLNAIYAQSLEAEATRILRFSQTPVSFPYAKKNLKPFLTEVMTLSVMMQKAQRYNVGNKNFGLSKIEIYANLSRDISAVSHLLEDGEYGKSEVLLTELIKRNPDENIFSNLMKLINTQKYVEATAISTDLKKKYTDALSKLAGKNLSKKILAVDDMPEILSFVNNALKNHYQVIAVTSGKAAMEALTMQKPDLFILDIDMPEMDGITLAKKIRASNEHKNTPLIFLTGVSTREHITNASVLGCDDFLVKPITHDYLLTTVGKYLNA